MKITEEDIEYAILNVESLQEAAEIAKLAWRFREEPPEGLDPSFYHTLSYEGDLKYHNRLKELLGRTR